MARGKFITLEGGEGAGKSTQAKKLAGFLRKREIKVVLTREVGGAPSAEEIRKLWLSKGEGYWNPVTELLLISAARREHLVKTIWPALKRGQWVVSDRFADSTRAYQGAGLKLDVKTIDALYRQIAGDFQPDLTLLLDLPVKAGLARMTDNDRYQRKNAGFHKAVRSAFLALAKKHKGRFVVINARQTTNGVQRDIRKTVGKRFRLKT